jgi:hypothetical protein
MITVSAYHFGNEYRFTADETFNDRQDAKIFETLSKQEFNRICKIAKSEFRYAPHVVAYADGKRIYEKTCK